MTDGVSPGPLQIGLLALGLVPLMAAAGVIQMQMLNGTYGDSDGLDGGASAGTILGGALNGVTTVTALNLQAHTAEKYANVRRGFQARVCSEWHHLGRDPVVWCWSRPAKLGCRACTLGWKHAVSPLETCLRFEGGASPVSWYLALVRRALSDEHRQPRN